ncbi:TPA: acyltransferase family protein [Enterobacter asburiae]
MNLSKNKMDGITILRFFAAFYVFIFHINMRSPLDFGSHINKSISNGAIGMSVFFMLSGFVLTYNYYNSQLVDYFKKRLARIYPAYLCCGVLSFPFLFTDNLTAGQIIACITLYLVCMQAWIYQSFSLWNFGGTWSVSVEMFFYSLFPSILKLITKNNVHLLILFAYIFSAALVPVSLIIGGPTVSSVYYATPIFRFPEFIIGICAAFYFLHGMRIKHSVFFISIIVFFYATSLSNVNMDTNFLITPTLAVIISYLGELKVTKNIFTSTLVYLGDISYSFYLMQLPLLMYLDRNPDSILRTHGFISWILAFSLNLFMAATCWHFIERNKALKSLFLKRTVRA